jgi:hypothetical protein
VAVQPALLRGLNSTLNGKETGSGKAGTVEALAVAKVSK